jgi:hypothetical protein
MNVIIYDKNIPYIMVSVFFISNSFGGVDNNDDKKVTINLKIESTENIKKNTLKEFKKLYIFFSFRMIQYFFS